MSDFQIQRFPSDVHLSDEAKLFRLLTTLEIEKSK